MKEKNIIKKKLIGTWVVGILFLVWSILMFWACSTVSIFSEDWWVIMPFALISLIVSLISFLTISNKFRSRLSGIAKFWNIKKESKRI